MFNPTLANFSFHCHNFMLLFSVCDNNFHMLTELCSCCTCNCNCNIFNRHRFQMLSGLLLFSTNFLLITNISAKVYLTTTAVQEGWCASRRWCSVWLWLLPFCLCHGSNVLCNAIDWLEYPSCHEKVSSHIIFGPLNCCSSKNILFPML